MRRAIAWSGICVVAMLGCTQTPHGPNESRITSDGVIAWPDDWSKHLGREVSVEGWAAYMKLGPVLTSAKEEYSNLIWIEGPSGKDGKPLTPRMGDRIRMTGMVIQRSDMPVYLAVRGTWPPKMAEESQFPYRAGIPVYSKEEYERSKKRFLLKDATWSVLD